MKTNDEADSAREFLKGIETGVTPLSSLIPQKQKTIIIQRPGSELPQSEIDKIVAEHKKHHVDEGLPLRMIVIYPGQTFESYKKDREIMANKEPGIKPKD